MKKNYLNEELSKEEKVYLKRIIMTARNKYFEKNHIYINMVEPIENNVADKDESIIENIIEKCQEDIMSAIEFENIFSEEKMYKIVRALSLKEKEVLFYLYKKQKTINEISKIMEMDRKTIRRIRNKAHEQIAKNIFKGE